MSFAADVKRFSEHTKKGIDKTVRAITFALFREVIQRTPVDTGRLKGNWQTSQNAPVVTTIERTNGGAAIAEVVTNGGGWGSVTYMANNLPYAQAIEFDGHSSVKAPEGMVRVSFARIQSIVRKAANDNKV